MRDFYIDIDDAVCKLKRIIREEAEVDIKYEAERYAKTGVHELINELKESNENTRKKNTLLINLLVDDIDRQKFNKLVRKQGLDAAFKEML